MIEIAGLNLSSVYTNVQMRFVVQSMRKFNGVRIRCLAIPFVFAAFVFFPTLLAQAQIPPSPAEGEFLHDLAGTISDAQEQAIRDYDPGSPGIKSFAHRWFDSWGIGTEEKNNGILMIISTGDRKGRIELGRAWRHRLDEYCGQVMNRDMIPQFKTGNYGAGIVRGAEKLADMAMAGKQSNPPK